VLYGRKHWTLKEARYKVDAFKIWLWRIPWTARRGQGTCYLNYIILPSFPTVHGKKANIIADIMMPLHSINLSVTLVKHIRMY
jgi:hypothetical protein